MKKLRFLIVGAHPEDEFEDSKTADILPLITL